MSNSWTVSLTEPALQIVQNATNSLADFGNEVAEHWQLPANSAGPVSAIGAVALSLFGIFYLAPRMERYLMNRLQPIPAGAIPGALPASPAALPGGTSSMSSAFDGRSIVGQPGASESWSITIVPEEVIAHIFRFLDITSVGRIASVCTLFERIQKENGIWFSFIPRLRSLEVDFGLPAKERARLLLAEIPIGEEGKCTLNPSSKTITITIPAWEALWNSLVEALSRSEVPNGSFVVFTFGTRQIPCAVIKDRKGVVRSIYDTRQFVNLNRDHHRGQFLTIIELRTHAGTPFQFQEFTLVQTDSILGNNDHPMIKYARERALRWLKGTANDND